MFVFGAAEQNLLRVPFTVKFRDQAAGVVVPDELPALEGEFHGTNNPTALFARPTRCPPATRSTSRSRTRRLRGENFDFESAQLDRAASANYSRHASSGGVKASLTSTLGRAWLSDVRVQAATDNRLEGPNSNAARSRIVGFGTIGGDNARPAPERRQPDPGDAEPQLDSRATTSVWAGT